MGLFRKERLCDGGMFQNMTDFHSHILPGVDDGVRTMDEALSALGYLEGLGISKLWLTPHIMEDYPNRTSDLKELFAQLSDLYKGRMELALAAENMLDSVFSRRLERNDFLPIGDNADMLLVEISIVSPSSFFSEMLSEVRSAGYFPLLAHPERYCYMTEKDYMKLYESGVRFQINIVSLAGFYGSEAKKKAHWMIRSGLVFEYGSDLHSVSSFDRAIHMKY